MLSHTPSPHPHTPVALAQALNLTLMAAAFVANSAARGAAVFASNAVVSLDGTDAETIDSTGQAAYFGPSNSASDYGDGIASDGSTVVWVDPPLAVGMAGTDLCPLGVGCRVAVRDLFGNTVTTATTAVRVEVIEPFNVLIDGMTPWQLSTGSLIP